MVLINQEGEKRSQENNGHGIQNVAVNDVSIEDTVVLHSYGLKLHPSKQKYHDSANDTSNNSSKYPIIRFRFGFPSKSEVDPKNQQAETTPANEKQSSWNLNQLEKLEAAKAA